LPALLREREGTHTLVAGAGTGDLEVTEQEGAEFGDWDGEAVFNAGDAKGEMNDLFPIFKFIKFRKTRTDDFIPSHELDMNLT
jgi:hypothetical protein